MNDNLYEIFRAEAVDSRWYLDPQELRIDLIGSFPHCVVSGNANQTFCGSYIHTQLASDSQGICFVYNPVDISPFHHLVGSSAIAALEQVEHELDIALVDAIYGLINRKKNIQPNRIIRFHGGPKKKAIDRAKYIVSLARPTSRDRVAVVGCVEPMIESLSESGAAIRIADLHTSEQTVCGIAVEKDAIPLLYWANKVILSGNTLWTRTLSRILEEVRNQKIFAIIYAMTGHHIAPRYINFGASVVVAEAFPYYWYINTDYKLEIYFRN